MAQLQFTVTITINPALAEGLTASTADFTEGEEGSVILTPITGGTPPYSAEVDAASPNALPAGLAVSIDAANNLILSGTPSVAGGPEPVLLDITDANGASVAKVAAKV